MKKSVLLLGLLTTALCLTACGWSKEYNMSFDEALEIANHSDLQDVLAWNDSFEQSFSIAGIYDSDWNKIDANLSSDSKQNLNNKNSESSINFGANITSEWKTMKVSWALDMRLVSDAIYLNLLSLDLTWDENLSLVAMMTAWFKNQWFVIPMTGLSEIPNTFSVFKDSEELNKKAKEIIVNEWATVYNWKFTQLNGYNAWKISLDNEKLNALIKEYYDSLYANLEGGDAIKAPEINIQNFEWYLVITWKDKVTTVIENMDMNDNNITVNANWFAGEDIELYLSESKEEVISIIANKKGSKYEVAVKMADAVSLNGTVSPKISKSSIDLKFDGKITLKAEAESEKDIAIPFNWSWKYKTISEFNTIAPENAQDLTELLWSYLWDAMWWYDETDYDYSDETVANLETAESLEFTENLEAVTETENN